MKKVLYILLTLGVSGFFVMFFLGLNPKCAVVFAKTTVISLKEPLVERLVFGDYDKTLWHINLSDKRITEAESLYRCGAKRIGDGKVLDAKKRREAALKYFEEAKRGGEDMNYLQQRVDGNSKMLSFY